MTDPVFLRNGYPRKENKYKIDHSPVRSHGLGPFFCRLPDFMVVRILKLLDEKSLSNMSEVSKIFYFFAEDDCIWKRICLKKRRGNFRFQGSWKRAALFDRNQVKPLPYKRLAVPEGFYSNYLFRKWYRRYTPLSQWNELPPNCKTIDKRCNLSLKEFIEEYDKKNKPVIITDAMKHWRATKEWTEEKLMEKYFNLPFKTDEVDPNSREKLYMNLEDYLDYCHLNHDEDPIYLFDNKFGDRKVADQILEDYEVPTYFKQDYLLHLEEERPPYRWFIIGPARSGTAWHTDPYRTSAWNALLKGRKRWFLYPYDVHPPGIDVEWDDDGNFESDSPEPIKWLVDKYPKIPENKKPIEVILEEGEVIFVPSGWWHFVINLTDTIAVTQNFCNDQNFDIVCAELEFDDDDLWGEFKKRVGKKEPQLKWPTKKITSGFRK